MYDIIWILIICSFLGWMVDVVFHSAMKRKIITRSILGGPVCLIYGIAAVFCTIFFGELKGSLLSLFLGCAVIFGGCEWTAGKLMEKVYCKKCWDYSGKKFSLDGYVSMLSMAVGGVAVAACIRWVIPFAIFLIHKMPLFVEVIAQVTVLVLMVMDSIFKFYVLSGLPQKFAAVEKVESRLSKVSAKLNRGIISVLPKRLRAEYTVEPRIKKEKVKPTVFAQGCSLYKLFLLFVIGAFLGDIAETIFCRITSGVWMSRSSLVWGPFSVVWGLSIAGGTLALYNYRERSDRFLFLFGTVLGGVFEYVCSVFTEIVFGQVFWDYSKMPFNLGGRINLLYCFFWGVAAVVWLKMLYPRISTLIEKIPMKLGKCLTYVLLAFMLADVVVSMAALSRYDARFRGSAPANAVEEWVDNHFDDEKMERIYPNSKKVESKNIEDIAETITEGQ